MATNLKNRFAKKLGKEGKGDLNVTGKISSRIRDFRTFLWNSKAGTVMGRTALSWAKISLYYAVFYTLLAGFFVMLFGIFATTINKRLPTFYNTESVMDYKGVNPGMGFRPMESERSNLILLDSEEARTFFANKYVEYANEFLTQNDTVNNIIDCMTNTSLELTRGKVCRYTFEQLNLGPCSTANRGGYQTDSPCVIIKLNRIIGWVPTKGESTLNSTLDPSFVYFQCSGLRASDQQFFPSLTYYSLGYPDGNKDYAAIPYSYFPYYNIYNYVPPFAVVHFENLKKDFLLNVVCRAYAPNIDNADTLNLRGMTHFQLFIKS